MKNEIKEKMNNNSEDSSNQAIPFYENNLFYYLLCNKKLLMHMISTVTGIKVVNVFKYDYEILGNSKKCVSALLMVIFLNEYNLKDYSVLMRIANYGLFNPIELENKLESIYGFISISGKERAFALNTIYEILFVTDSSSFEEGLVHEYELSYGKTIYDYIEYHLLYVELEKAKYLDENEINNWSEMECLAYMFKYGHDDSKKDLINKLVQKHSELATLLEKREEFKKL